jgi:hypothetical protein
MRDSSTARFLGTELDKRCETCGGSGISCIALNLSGGFCARCDGTGYELTEAGEALLAFSKRHAPPTSLAID